MQEEIKLLEAPKKLKRYENVGRKWFDLTEEDKERGRTEESIISDCKEIWSIGGTDKQAASYANISNKSLSRYLKVNPEIAEIRDRLQENPVIQAKRTIFANLNDPQIAKWLLERKAKDEFGNAVDLTSRGEKIGGNEINFTNFQ